MRPYARWFTVALLVCSLLFLLTPSPAKATPPEYWIPGIEQQFFGHTFTEEYWTNDSIIVENENGSAQIIASYVNYSENIGGFQAMLIALGIIEDENGTLSTFPFQLFGLHFTTRDDKDVFVGALLAFLFGYNDTNGDGVPNLGENRFYILPYGYNTGNSSGPPSVEAIEATKLTSHHYRFGISYKNLYARLVSSNSENEFLVTLLIPFFEITFSELTITYDILVNPETGEVTTETFYTIGQLSDLRFLGISIPNPHDFLEDIGVGVAHLTVIFTSTYYVRTRGMTPISAIDRNLANVTTDLFGRQRAFSLGTRGTYNVINESTSPPSLIQDKLPAYSWILTPQSTDLFLLLLQLIPAADILSIFAYAMSSHLQDQFTGPLQLYENADTVFNAAAFWYAVAFPEYNGYRVEHDPVYTAYSNIGMIRTPAWLGLVFMGTIVLIGLIVLVLIIIRANGRNKDA